MQVLLGYNLQNSMSLVNTRRNALLAVTTYHFRSRTPVLIETERLITIIKSKKAIYPCHDLTFKFLPMMSSSEAVAIECLSIVLVRHVRRILPI